MVHLDFLKVKSLAWGYSRVWVSQVVFRETFMCFSRHSFTSVFVAANTSGILVS